MTTTKQAHVVILGGGAIGVSTAKHALDKGARVTLITEAGLASGASGRSLSWLNSAGERTKAYHELRLAGIERYRALAAANPGIDWLKFDGGVFWGEDSSATHERHNYEAGIEYPTQLVADNKVGEVAPGVNSASVIDKAIYNPEEGWVSLPHLIEHLISQVKDAGGSIVENAGRCSVVTEDGRATGVRTENGDVISGDFVVVACGAATPKIAAELGVQIDDASPLSMLVISEKFDVPEAVVLNTPRAAVRPNPGKTIAVDHDWYEGDIVTHDDGTYSIPESTVNELLAEASKILEGEPEIKAAKWDIGRKPIPGDGEPVFGELEKVPGCYVAFTHSGATLALLAGELISSELLDGEKSPMLANFRPERFDRS